MIGSGRVGNLRNCLENKQEVINGGGLDRGDQLQDTV